jgi:hypothetical protein
MEAEKIGLATFFIFELVFVDDALDVLKIAPELVVNEPMRIPFHLCCPLRLDLT